MAYRRNKRYTKKKCYGKPTVYSSSTYLANKALQGVKYLKGLVNSELLKYTNTQAAVNVPLTTPTVYVLNNISQADGVANRTGNSILMKHLTFRGTVDFGPTSGTCMLKYWFFMDTQQIGDTSPTFADMFYVNGVNSILNQDTAGRFKILKSGLVTKDTSTNIKQLSVDISMQTHAKYNGANASDIQKNGLYVVFVSTTNTAMPTVAYTSRVSYHDN